MSQSEEPALVSQRAVGQERMMDTTPSRSYLAIMRLGQGGGALADREPPTSRL